MNPKNSLILMLLAISLVGCTKVSEPKPAEASATPASVAKEPISQALLDEMGKKIVKAVMESDGETLREQVDYAALAERVLAPYDLDSQMKQGFTQGFLGELEKKPLGLFTEMTGSNVTFVKSHQVEGQSRILIRIVAAEDVGGFQFLDLLVENRPDGPRVVDYYSFLGGELISSTIGRLFAPALLKAGTSAGEAEMGGIEDLERLVAAVHASNWEKANAIYLAMDAEMKDKKFVQLMYLQAAVELDDEVYLKALHKFEKDFPDDPSLVLVQLDTFFLEKEFQKVVDGLNDLQASLEIQDAYVKTLQASALAESGRGKEAVTYLKEAVKLEPTLEDARWALIEMAIEEDDFSTVADNLNALLPEYPDLVEGVPSEEFYRPFMASQVGKDWLKAAKKS